MYIIYFVKNFVKNIINFWASNPSTIFRAHIVFQLKLLSSLLLVHRRLYFNVVYHNQTYDRVRTRPIKCEGTDYQRVLYQLQRIIHTPFNFQRKDESLTKVSSNENIFLFKITEDFGVPY